MDGGDIKYVDSATGNFSGEQSCCNVTPDTETEGGESGARGMRKQESRGERERERGRKRFLARPWEAARGTRLPCGASPTLRTSDNNGKGFQHPPCAQARIKSAETTPRLELINLRVVPLRAEFVPMSMTLKKRWITWLFEIYVDFGKKKLIDKLAIIPDVIINFWKIEQRDSHFSVS